MIAQAKFVDIEAMFIDPLKCCIRKYSRIVTGYDFTGHFELYCSCYGGHESAFLAKEKKQSPMSHGRLHGP